MLVLIDQQATIFPWIINYSASITSTTNIPRRLLAGKACKLSDFIMYLLMNYLVISTKFSYHHPLQRGDYLTYH
jgi:hypothetical protein